MIIALAKCHRLPRGAGSGRPATGETADSVAPGWCGLSTEVETAMTAHCLWGLSPVSDRALATHQTFTRFTTTDSFVDSLAQVMFMGRVQNSKTKSVLRNRCYFKACRVPAFGR